MFIIREWLKKHRIIENSSVMYPRHATEARIRFETEAEDPKIILRIRGHY